MWTKTIAAVALSTILLGSAAFAQNSGAGKSGLPGSKSGPTVSPERDGTPPDTSGVKGLPGNKSGPAVPPPKSEDHR